MEFSDQQNKNFHIHPNTTGISAAVSARILQVQVEDSTSVSVPTLVSVSAFVLPTQMKYKKLTQFFLHEYLVEIIFYTNLSMAVRKESELEAAMYSGSPCGLMADTSASAQPLVCMMRLQA